MQPQNAAEHKWLFDYDSSKDLDRFVEDLTLEGFKENEIEVHKTVHNYAVIVSHGFVTCFLALILNGVNSRNQTKY